MYLLAEYILILGSSMVAFIPIFLRIRNVSVALRSTETKLMVLCRMFMIFLIISIFILNIDLFYICLRLGEDAFNINIFLNVSKSAITLFFIFFICLFFYEPFFDDYIFPFRVYEFYSLICFQLIGVFSFISASHIISCYLTLELQSLSFAILLASNYLSRLSSEASIKYFMLGSFSTALLLLSFVFFYGFFGITNFSSVYYLIGDITELINMFDFFYFFCGMFILFLAFFFKIGIAPFHLWIIDVYEGIPLILVLFLMVVPKFMYLIFLIKWFFLLLPKFNFVLMILCQYVGFFSIIFGTLGAVLQKSIRRLFAYSGIANFGYIFVAFNIVTASSYSVIMIFIVFYIFLICQIFFCFFSSFDTDTTDFFKTITEFGTWFVSFRVFWCFFLAFGMFSMAGIPPLNMYFIKYMLLYSLLNSENIFDYFICILIILFSILSCFYYIRLIRLLFFRQIAHVISISLLVKPLFVLSWCSVVLVFFNLFYFFFPDFFLFLFFIFFNN